MPVTADQFRSAMRQWASGVSVVTTRRDDGLQAITVSSFCSLSLDPPLVLICIDHRARSHALIEREDAFAVNFLREEQKDLSELAAGRSGERGAWLEGVERTTALTGAPILKDCLVWLDCSLVARHQGGDHTIFVGRVEAAGGSTGRPLLHFQGDYRGLAAREPAAAPKIVARKPAGSHPPRRRRAGRTRPRRRPRGA